MMTRKSTPPTTPPMRKVFDLGLECSPLAAGELGKTVCSYICEKRRVIKRTNCPKSVITKIAEVDALLTVVGPEVTVVDARFDDGPGHVGERPWYPMGG